MIFKTCIVILMIFIFAEIGSIADAMQDIAKAFKKYYEEENVLTKDDEQ